MGSILLWTGIGLTVIGWIALAYQASRRMAVKSEMARLPGVRGKMRLRRNYCLLTIFAGMLLIVIATVV